MKKYELDMSHGSIVKKMILFSIPLMLSGVLQLLFNAADIIIVGKFEGEIALAAVGSTTSLINLIVNIFMGYATGAAVVISRHFGAQNAKRTHTAVNSCITMSLLFGIILMIVGMLLGKPLLKMTSCPSDVLNSAALYLKIYFAGMPAFMLYNFGGAVLRAVGDTKRPLCYLSIAGVINVVLNLFFVIKLHLGVAGVAAATAISQCVSAFLVIRCLILSEESYRFNPRNIKIDRKEFLQMTKIGLPAGIQGSFFSIANVTIQSVINSFGATAVAGNAAGVNIEGFVYILVNSVNQAVLTFTGQNLGARKPDRIKKGIFAGLGLQVTVVLSISLIVNHFSHSLASLYTSDPEVIQIAANRMGIIAVTYFLCGFNEVFVAGLRGLGNSTSSMIISLFGICGLRLLYIATVFKAFNSLESLYITYPLSWTITAIINGTFLFIVFRRMNKVDKY